MNLVLQLIQQAEILRVDDYSVTYIVWTDGGLTILWTDAETGEEYEYYFKPEQVSDAMIHDNTISLFNGEEFLEVNCFFIIPFTVHNLT